MILHAKIRTVILETRLDYLIFIILILRIKVLWLLAVFAVPTILR